MNEPNLNYPSVWNPAEKFLFRFAFLFFCLFIILENNGAYPLFYFVSSLIEEPLHYFIPWVGKCILHLPYEITVFTNGSGDTTYDYVIVFTIFLFSTFGAVIWSFADRGRTNYSILYYWLSTFIRYYVGCMLINYGLVKVFKCQFPAPDLYRLNETYGESSPMGLAWAFLGFSKGYNLFMGIAELAGILLLFRRTMTAGLLIALMTTTNVMAVNYCYDVPVKILSTMLVVMTLFLLLRDAKRLFIFFFTGRAINLPVIPGPELKVKLLRIIKYIFKGAILVHVIIIAGIEVMEMEKLYGDNAPKTRLYGVYTVKSMIHTDADSLDNEKDWKQVIVEGEYNLCVKFSDNSSLRYNMESVNSGNFVTLTRRKGNKDSGFLEYATPDSNVLSFKGNINKDRVFILLIKDSIPEYELTKRGFHWINEYPNNK